VDTRENIEISNLTMQLIFSIFVFFLKGCLTFNAISLSSLHTFFSPGLNQKGKISKTLFSLVDLSNILSHSHSHSLLSLVDHSPPPAQPQATTRGDRPIQINTDRDREREEIWPTHSHWPLISVDHRYSLSISLTLSLVLISLSYPLMFR
jgi:hypothetical protein